MIQYKYTSKQTAKQKMGAFTEFLLRYEKFNKNSKKKFKIGALQHAECLLLTIKKNNQISLQLLFYFIDR